MREQRHPELADDEVLIGYWTEEFYEISNWQTKRRGMTVLDAEGNPVAGGNRFPVFIKKQELDSHYVSVSVQSLIREKSKQY